MAKRFTHDANCAVKREIRWHFLMLLLSRPAANFWRTTASIFRMSGRGAVTLIRPAHPGVRQSLRVDAFAQHLF
jgi:hypothetical protein